MQWKRPGGHFNFCKRYNTGVSLGEPGALATGVRPEVSNPPPVAKAPGSPSGRNLPCSDPLFVVFVRPFESLLNLLDSMIGRLHRFLAVAAEIVVRFLEFFTRFLQL